jgi:hypothetical protein
MKPPNSWRPTMFVASLVTCAVCLGCAATSQTARASTSSACTGARTLVVHNGTARTVEIVLTQGSGGTATGVLVLEVLDPGQKSRPIYFSSSVSGVYVRDKDTNQLIESPRLRFEHGCNNDASGS